MQEIIIIIMFLFVIYSVEGALCSVKRLIVGQVLVTNESHSLIGGFITRNKVVDPDKPSPATPLDLK